MAQLPACELLEGHRDRGGIPAFEKDHVVVLLGGGVLLPGEIHMVFFATWVKALVFLLLISILVSPAFYPASCFMAE